MMKRPMTTGNEAVHIIAGLSDDFIIDVNGILMILPG